MPLGIPAPSATRGSGEIGTAVHGFGDAMPPGIESLLEYRGLTLNNRQWADTFVVEEIDGLADADIRDDREVNPSQHGETAFDALYGGRTIVMTGFIRAFRLDKLNDMRQALREAFMDISQESPLIFHTADPDNDIQIYCKKIAPIAMKDVQQDQNIFKRAFMVSVRASNPRFTSITEKLKIQKLGIVDEFTTDTLNTQVVRTDRTNRITNPGFEVDTAGWSGALSNYRINSGATLTRVTTQAKYGSAALRIVTPGTTALTGADTSFAVTNGEVVTVSAWVKGNVGGEQVQLVAGDATVGSAFSSAITLTTDWQRISVTFTATASGTTGAALRQNQSGYPAITFFTDGVLAEPSAALSPFFSGNGYVNDFGDFVTDPTVTRWTGTANASISEKGLFVPPKWDFLAAAGTLSISGGQMVPSSTAQKRLKRNDMGVLFKSPQIRVDYVPDATFTSSRVGGVFCYIDSQNYLYAYIDASGNPVFGKVDGGANSTLTATTTSGFPVSRSAGNVYTAYLAMNYVAGAPALRVAQGAAVATHVLTGPNLTKYGGVLSDPYADLTPGSTGWRYNEIHFYPYRLVSDSIFTIANDGNFNAFPVLKIEGAITNPVITNLTTGKSMSLTGVLASGEVWTIDTAKKKITDQNGVNKFSAFAVGSNWLELAPGNNAIALTGDSVSDGQVGGVWEEPYLSIQHNNTWM